MVIFDPALVLRRKRRKRISVVSGNIQLRAKDYYSFTTMVLLAMGIVFELPVFVLSLVRLGILSTRQLRSNRRMGYFVIACVGVALPGIDPITTVIETVPHGGYRIDR